MKSSRRRFLTSTAAGAAAAACSGLVTNESQAQWPTNRGGGQAMAGGPRSAAKGYALCLGLNVLHPNVFPGADPLRAAENDATSMSQLLHGRGFQVRRLLSRNATLEAVRTSLNKAITDLVSGDSFVLTLASHGAQRPDTSGDEGDGADEFFCAYNERLFDDELYAMLSRFRAGVRVTVVSDTCHNGTITRYLATEGLMRGLEETGEAPVRSLEASRTRSDEPVASEEIKRVTRAIDSAMRSETTGDFAVFRSLPEWVVEDMEQDPQRVDFANAVKRRFRNESESERTAAASIISLAACTDQEQARDGTRNGLFTENLLNFVAGGLPLKALGERIGTVTWRYRQNPYFYTVGPRNQAFEAQPAFTV